MIPASTGNETSARHVGVPFSNPETSVSWLRKTSVAVHVQKRRTLGSKFEEGNSLCLVEEARDTISHANSII